MEKHYHGLRPHAEMSATDHGADVNAILRDPTLGRISNSLAMAYLHAKDDAMPTACEIVMGCQPLVAEMRACTATGEALYAQACDRVGLAVPPKPPNPEEAEQRQTTAQLSALIEPFQIDDESIVATLERLLATMTDPAESTEGDDNKGDSRPRKGKGR